MCVPNYQTTKCHRRLQYLINHNVTCLSVTSDRVWIGNRIYWTLRHVTTNNYDSLTELHNRKITVSTAHIKFSQFSLAVAWKRLPTTDVLLPLRSRTVPVSQLPASHFSPVTLPHLRVAAYRQSLHLGTKLL
jgi:hypothetical protein